MPSPIAHISVGYVIYRMLIKSLPEFKNSRFTFHVSALLLCLFLSLFPDMDCVPAVFVGDLKPFHNYYSHSIFAVLLVSIPLTFLVKFVVKTAYVRAYGFTAGVVLLHVLMDLLGWGRGQMLFWPISEVRVNMPFYIFYGLRWSDGWWSINHLWTVLSEGLFAVCIIALAHCAPSRRSV